MVYKFPVRVRLNNRDLSDLVERVNEITRDWQFPSGPPSEPDHVTILLPTKDDQLIAKLAIL